MIKGNIIRALALGLTATLLQITPQSWITRELLWENANVTFAAYLLWASTSNKKPQLNLAVGKTKTALQSDLRNQGT